MTMEGGFRTDRGLQLHIAVLAVLFALHFVLPDYHHGNLARIMVLATYAVGYNVLFGYTGLLSLGHAMFFAAGLYGAGLTAQLLGWTVLPALIAGLVAATVLAGAVGVLALRTAGVSFMIVTMMFAQAGYLATLYFGEYTRGDEGFVIASAARTLFGLDVADADTRYLLALVLFGTALMATLSLVRSPSGRVLVAIRENEDRAVMLGYNTFRYKLMAVLVSGCIAGAAGAAYGLLFGYVGSSFASIHQSILPLLYVLLGGMGTTLGPLLGAAAMFYLIDVASSLTSAHLVVVGLTLVALILFFPKGVLGTIRERYLPWLP